MARTRSLVTALVLSFCTTSTLALSIDTTNTTSISQAAAAILNGLMLVNYNPNATTGHFKQPEPWYWWLSGDAWTGIMDYTVYTGDKTYEKDILSALSDPVNLGTNYDMMAAAQQGWEANDDQAYWLYNALTALEYNFTAISPCVPSSTGKGGCANSWLSIATNVFDEFVARWANDSVTCGGGLKWQYNPKANGYYYKNSVANGGFFQTAARLARYTGNSTYADWATKIWDWSVAIGMVSPEFNVYDGTGDAGTANCSAMDHDQWSYNLATYLHGTAAMYAYTSEHDPSSAGTWQSRVHSFLLSANQTFFSPPGQNATGVMYEQKCEMDLSCSTDQTAFKSSLARWMAKTAVLVPGEKDLIMSLLATSAEGAVKSCVLAYGVQVCGMTWWDKAGFDGKPSFGAQLSALEVVTGLLVGQAPALAKI